MQNKWLLPLSLSLFTILIFSGAVSAFDSAVGEPITIENVTRIQPVAEIGKGAINDIAVSTDGQKLAVETSTKIWLYSLPDFNEISHIDIGDNPFFGSYVAWQPNGNLLAVIAGKNLSIWDTATGNLKLKTPLDGYGMSWTPDGKTLITVSDEVVLWDVETLKHREVFNVIGNAQKVMALSPDGTLLYVASRYSTIDSSSDYLEVWNMVSGELISTLRDLTTEISAIAVSPDSTQVAYSYLIGQLYVTDAMICPQ